MKKNCIFYILISCCIFILSSQLVRADMGPYPRVRIRFRGLPNDGEVYATLIAKEGKCDYYTAAIDRGKGRSQGLDIPNDIWQRFIDYKDPDGFICYSFLENVSDTGFLEWGFDCPDEFKLLIYVSDRDQFIISEIVSPYAFTSEFLAVIDEGMVQLSMLPGIYSLLKSFGLRVLCTLILEMSLAFYIGIRDKRRLLIILFTNFFTQLCLTLYLYNKGFIRWFWQFFALFILAEIIVSIAEAVIYVNFLDKRNKKHVRNYAYVPYAFGANALSLIMGFILTKLFPNIF